MELENFEHKLCGTALLMATKKDGLTSKCRVCKKPFLLEKIETKMKTKGKGTLSECPVCKSEKIQGDGLEMDNDYVWQKIECQDCYTSWFEDYKCVGWEMDYNGKTNEELNR